MNDQITTDKKAASTAQTQLDNLVVNIELTLISIIQGVALSFLADHSHELLVGLQLAFWPYAITGLVIILLFWSRSLIHTLTVIRWPLDFGHNFMYIACTLVQTVAFTQITNVLHWYALNMVFGLMLWILFALDLRMIRRRISDSEGAIGSRLYAILEREQFVTIRFFAPALVIFNLLAVIALRLWPVYLIQDGGHTIIALVQMGASFGYLLYVIRFFARIVPLVVKTRQEWRDEVFPKA
jgi:hypothetical protein